MTRFGELKSQIGDAVLVAVSKSLPFERLLALYEEGCRDFGESRIQQALPKMELAPKDIRWHYIGTLQTNKVTKVVGNFYLIHSVDSVKLAEKIDQVSKEKGLTTSVLLQVNASGEASKHGFSPEELVAAYSGLSKLSHIRIEGIMTMAPLTENREEIRAAFRTARRLADELHLPIVSMGMSHDWEIALEEGATHLRIGSLLIQD